MKIYIDQITNQIILSEPFNGLHYYEQLHPGTSVTLRMLKGKSPAELCLIYIGDLL